MAQENRETRETIATGVKGLAVRMTWKKPIMHRHSLLEYNYGKPGFGDGFVFPKHFL
jgi:hypothetical protein